MIGLYPKSQGSRSPDEVLLILDDFGLAHLDRKQQMDLMEIIEDRYNKTSMVISSHILLSAWYDIIGKGTIAMPFWTGS